MIFSTFFAWSMLHIQNHYNFHLRKEEMFALGTLNFLSMILSISALEFVSFPVQALIKSSKILSILLVSPIIASVTRSSSQYVSGFTITAGSILFNLMVKLFIQDESPNDQRSSWFGIFLCVASLFTDGLNGNYQDNLIHTQKHKINSYELMFSTCGWTGLFSLAYMFLNEELHEFVYFCSTYPNVMVDIVWISISGTIGQFFIYYTLTHFGAFVLSMLTTTRKFFTVLASILFYRHPVNEYQFFGIILVIGGVLYEVRGNTSSHNIKRSRHSHDDEESLVKLVKETK